MKLSVVTTFSPKGYEVYGRKMIESFATYWPTDVPLYVYYEGEKPADAHERATWMPLESDEDRTAFLKDHSAHDPNDYRFNAARYSHKVFAQTRVFKFIADGSYLFWMDADTETKNLITREVVDQLIPPGDKIASYLARPYHRHTETGFIGYGPNAGPFLDEMRRVYVSGEIFKLPEWHDCAVFDHVRVKFERQGYRFHNLCPEAMGLAVFEQSPLARFIRHNKGPERKDREYGDPMLTG